MKYLLLYNPVSGKAKFKKKIPFIKSYFKKKNLSLDIYKSMAPKDLEHKAELFAPFYDVIIISGGDGTVNEVLNGIMKVDKKPNIAVLPSGTANDVAAILGMTKNIKKNLDIITNKEPIAMDVNELNNRFFLYTTAAGMLTKISYDVPRKYIKRYGYFAYLIEGAKDLLKDYKMPMYIEHDDGNTKGRFMLVLGLSSKRVGGMFFRKFSQGKLNDGKFELRLIEANKVFKIGKLILFFLSAGKYQASKDIHLSSSYYKIWTSSDVTWNTDGERSLSGNIEINVLKQAINVYATDKSKKKNFIL